MHSTKKQEESLYWLLNPLNEKYGRNGEGEATETLSVYQNSNSKARPPSEWILGISGTINDLEDELW